ncbi:MAG: hypothetical protein AAF988_00450 [Pseudomonadota bacterium]
MINNNILSKRIKEAGNVFFTLFAAVGVVGAIGLGSTAMLQGPVQTMVKINQKQVTEDYGELGLRVMMANILQTDANCDADNKLEAAAWVTPGVGEGAPTGGGVFPDTFGTKVTDPWGRRLGYCVWDHGSAIDDAGCGGATQNRLQGPSNDDTQPFITIISSGANQVFETSCNDYVDTTPADGSPDTPLLGRVANSDDLIINYSMDEAQAAMGDNWVFDTNIDGSGDAATTDINLDFSQDVTFDGILDFARLGGGLILPDISGAACNGTTEGQLFRDSATTPPAVMVCRSGTFEAMSGSGGGAGIIGDPNFDPKAYNCVTNNGGPLVEVASIATNNNQAQGIIKYNGHIIVSDETSGNDTQSYLFNGSSFTKTSEIATPDRSVDLWYEDQLYLAGYFTNLLALSFNGSSFSTLDSSAPTGASLAIWGDGQYIYTVNTSGNLDAHSFNGSTLTLLDTYNMGARVAGIWGDGTYIYINNFDTEGIDAVTFNGTNFAVAGTTSAPGGGDIWGDDTYIYTTHRTNGIRAYTFDGTNFTLAGSESSPGDAQDIWGDGTHIYVGARGAGMLVYTFDGTNFNLVHQENTSGSAHGIWGDGQYIYLADYGGGVRAYSGFECLKAGNGERPNAPNTGVDYNYRAYAWGLEEYGEHGDDSTAVSTAESPVLVAKDNEFYQVSTYRNHSCGLKTDGSAWCWGRDIEGQLGNGPDVTADQNFPYPVSGDHKFIKIDTALTSTCALKADGTIWCWGDNTNGRLGIGSAGGSSDIPVQVVNISDFIDMGTHRTHGCGLRKNGEIWCWGRDVNGVLGNGSESSDQPAPVKVQANVPFVSMGVGYVHSCGVDQNGSAWCWGLNDHGQIGTGSITADVEMPIQVQSLDNLKSIHTNSTHTCGLKENGELFCWGNNNSGRIGNGSINGTVLTPTKVVNLEDVVDVGLGATYSCAVKADGLAYCWGSDGNGSLGNGSTITGNQGSPTLVENITNVVDISCHNQNCIVATKIQKPVGEPAPEAPVIIEQKTTAGNTSGSHGLSTNFDTNSNDLHSGIAFKIDAEDTDSSDNVSAAITGKASTTTKPGLRFRTNNGASVDVSLRLQETGSLNISRTGGADSPKLVSNDGAGSSWNPTRFDTGFLVSDVSGADQPAFYGIDSDTGNAIILSGQDLLIQHATTTGATSTSIALFDKSSNPEFYGNISLSGNNRNVTITAASDTAAETAAFNFLRYRGSSSSPSILLDQDEIGTLIFQGFDGANYDANGSTIITAQVSGVPSGSNVPTDLIIEQSAATNERLIRLPNSGGVIIGDNATIEGSDLFVSGRGAADKAVKAGNDNNCSGVNDVGMLRFTGSEYEYCDGSSWISLVDRSCKDQAKIIDISISRRTTCATFSNGRVACWGENDNSESGLNDTTSPKLTLTEIKTLKGTKARASGGSFVCSLNDDQSIKCWGLNNTGRLGTGSLTSSTVPLSVASNEKYIDLAVSDEEGCALRTDGRVDCWGNNTSGELGLGDTVRRTVPTTVPNLSNIVSITAGKDNFCSLGSDRTVKCWGRNLEGQLGIGTTTSFESVPQDVAITDVIDISSGGAIASSNNISGTCALRANGTVWCWGRNIHGQVGNGTSGTTSVNTPTQVTGITDAVDISRAGGSACAIIDDGTIECWGLGSVGQLGQGTFSSSTVPVTVSNIDNAVKLSEGSSSAHICAVLTDGSARCWGSNDNGQLGNNATSSSNVPVDVINPLSCNSDKYVFVTSELYDGNLGGIEGADAICQAHADRANLPGTYLAWLSDDTTSPAQRFNRSDMNYILVDDTVVANGWSDLTDGDLDNSIGLDEKGNIRAHAVATNTTFEGEPSSSINSCNNWASQSASLQHSRGASGFSNSFWSSGVTINCSDSVRLYCFQQ